MIDASAFKAEFVGTKEIRTRQVVQFVFEVDLSQADSAHAILGGFKKGPGIWCGIARISHDASEEERDGSMKTQPAPGPPTSSPARVPRKWEDIPYEEQAGILGNDPDFRDWLKDFLGKKVFGYTDAAMHIRSYCGVDSRKSILPNTLAGNRWNLMVSAFRERAA